MNLTMDETSTVTTTVDKSETESNGKEGGYTTLSRIRASLSEIFLCHIQDSIIGIGYP